jgi:hypothetical protein
MNSDQIQFFFRVCFWKHFFSQIFLDKSMYNAIIYNKGLTVMTFEEKKFV